VQTALGANFFKFFFNLFSPVYIFSVLGRPALQERNELSAVFCTCNLVAELKTQTPRNISITLSSSSLLHCRPRVRNETKYQTTSQMSSGSALMSDHEGAVAASVWKTTKRKCICHVRDCADIVSSLAADDKRSGYALVPGHIVAVSASIETRSEESAPVEQVADDAVDAPVSDVDAPASDVDAPASDVVAPASDVD
jgi:hypothetical protein